MQSMAPGSHHCFGGGGISSQSEVGKEGKWPGQVCCQVSLGDWGAAALCICCLQGQTTTFSKDQGLWFSRRCLSIVYTGQLGTSGFGKPQRRSTLDQPVFPDEAESDLTAHTRLPTHGAEWPSLCSSQKVQGEVGVRLKVRSQVANASGRRPSNLLTRPQSIPKQRAHQATSAGPQCWSRPCNRCSRCC